jgi:hypothetical protein
MVQVNQDTLKRVKRLSVFVVVTAIINSGDLGLPSLFLTFTPSSGNGAEKCASVIILSDKEAKEDVKVMLSLVTTGESISLGNSITTIAITAGIHT